MYELFYARDLVLYLVNITATNANVWIKTMNSKDFICFYSNPCGLVSCLKVLPSSPLL